MAKKTITITEARKKLFEIADDVQKPDTYYELTVEGAPRVIIMSRDEFDSIMETMEIMSDPEIVKDLEQAERDYKKGNYISWKEAKKQLGIRGADLIMRDKGKRKYGKSKKK